VAEAALRAPRVEGNQTMETKGHSGVDWETAPRRARWWAMDADGKAHWYCEPDVAAHTNFWFPAQEAAPDFGYAGDYRQSLTERPPDEAR
jgi:hypothetical protein